MNTYELLQLNAKGDETAKEKLIQNNMRLIYMVVNRFKDRGIEQDDLFQLAAIGFIKAVDRFDISLGLKLSTYAVPLMMGEIKRFLRDDNVIKVSRHYKILVGKATKIRDEILNQTGKEPTLSEISVILKTEPEELASAFSAVQVPDSLDVSLNDSDYTLRDRIPDNNNSFSSIFIKDMIYKLPERERKILIWRYLQGETQTMIAKKLGISQVQVSRIEKNILTKLKRELNA